MSNPIEYTLVVGVDAKHLKQLSVTWPTWKKHKPALLKRPMLVIVDKDQVPFDSVVNMIDHPDLTLLSWPPDGVTYDGNASSRFLDPQRYKMLAGFVHVSQTIDTPYFLKLDTDVVATGQDSWINPDWFGDYPAIISHAWSFTKPADQMLKLDRWAAAWKKKLPKFPEGPLKLTPKEGSDRLGHKRIISWCSFWRTDFVGLCSALASETIGDYLLPVPSHDGFLWYMAQRMDEKVVRCQMKKLGWQQWHTDTNIRKHAEEAMRDG